ncbi:UDP-N-acetylmuramoyl-L-alanine--D-glutamate ligase [Eubacterium oxidoreducens]|uniref:UDP-N-acetylmuramoylalanine--D-glutamate ligase n=1 Tax=Eubacterium oxidoreducens TaxID=1732 RepID=A0A1G6AFY7_EUBOX|nr:UDP-N-acetylmuramoyl-L-alanine--D-glutamate ligase [Eubacterium oxidoreducens]SDB07240.1 UDP-N-acetylmuramoylalanine--D-glutamate ligase [Eubacterium oxidoreducens]
MKNKKVLVYGTGISGIAASALLLRHEAQVFLYDENENKVAAEIAETVKGLDEEHIVLGSLEEKFISSLDLVVLSPGIPLDNPNVLRLKEAGLPIWGEIELGYYFEKGRVLAITGTNGKTTTTALLGKIMEAAYNHSFVVGNIGIPYTSIADQTMEDSVTVAEISSFQLETAIDFKPQVSAILNITPDHLNRHHTMDCYVDAKMAIAKNQGPSEYMILNYEDEILRKRAQEVKAKVIYFSSKRRLEEGIYLANDQIFLKIGDDYEMIAKVKELQLIGNHNYENVMAAAAMAYCAGAGVETISKVVKEFVAVEHRIEYVDTVNGVRYYNDSKGTNPDAAIQAIKAMQWPTCLIGGGYDKQSEFDEWIASFDGKVKKLVLIGQTAQKIADTAEKMGFKDYEFADSLEEAVRICAENAKSGDAVLLSPACASWGMFDNYEQRGDMFKEFVREMKG